VTVYTKYSSKILLFGEHTVNRGSNALAIPYPTFGGEWAYSLDFSQQQNLSAFATYLENLQQEGILQAELDLTAFRAELAKGLYFNANIPMGYGLGSSGALCAAVYDRFCKNKMERTESERYAELRSALAQLECFFHGASSATDVLVAYLNQPLIIRGNGLVETVTLPKNPTLTFFLLDTETVRSAGTWVKYFLQRCEKADFKTDVVTKLVWYNNEVIANFLNAQWDTFFENITDISHLQINQLAEMTPPAFHQIWQESLKEKNYRLKLCGAGGGGFILGITFDWQQTQLELSTYKLLKVNTN